MPEQTRTEGGQSCPPGGATTDSSISRPPQIAIPVTIAVAMAAAVGGLLGALIGTRLAR